MKTVIRISPDACVVERTAKLQVVKGNTKRVSVSTTSLGFERDRHRSRRRTKPTTLQLQGRSGRAQESQALIPEVFLGVAMDL